MASIGNERTINAIAIMNTNVLKNFAVDCFIYTLLYQMRLVKPTALPSILISFNFSPEYTNG